MSILLSVNPPYAEWLVSGEKTIEWRKKPLPFGKAYIYETKKGGGRGAVIGAVEVLGYTKFSNECYIQEETIKDGRVDIDYLRLYMGLKPIYANHVLSPRRYYDPKPLSDFRLPCDHVNDCGTCQRYQKQIYGWAKCKDKITRPPQSWCYVEEVDQ